MTHLSLKAKSNKIDANKVSYEPSYEAPLTTKTRLKNKCRIRVESQVLMHVTNEEIDYFAKISQYISIKNPLYKQSEKACMCF